MPLLIVALSRSCIRIGCSSALRRIRCWHPLLCLALLCAVAGCGGGGSNGNDPQQPNPAPVVTGISPNSAVAGDAGFTLSVSGSGFISSSSVQWNGTALATSYVSSSSLTAQIPASSIGSEGTAEITVQNPAPGGGTSKSASFTIHPQPNPIPVLTSLSPAVATAGGASFTLTATGSGFLSASEILWNGSSVPTAFGSSTSLTAQIPASDIASAGTADISVQNPAPGGGTSGRLSLTIRQPATNVTVMDLQGNDVVWDQSQKRLYVAVPDDGSGNASSITTIDPAAGTIVSSQPLSTPPTMLAISSDSGELYAVTDAGAGIARFTLPDIKPDVQWSLGKDKLSNDQIVAGGIAVHPTSSHTVAISMGPFGMGSIGIFDDATERSGVGSDVFLGGSPLWKADGSMLYAGGSELATMPVDQNGVGPLTVYHSTFRGTGARLHLDAEKNRVYDNWGEVVDPATGTPVGYCAKVYPTPSFVPGPLAIEDSDLQRFYIVVRSEQPDHSMDYEIQSFDANNFRLLETIMVPNASGMPVGLVRWGSSGLALLTLTVGNSPGKLYLVDGSFVNPFGASDTALGSPVISVPVVTSISPLSAAVGSGGTTFTVMGSRFEPSATVYWNGTAIPTTVTGSGELTAQIPASDLTTSTLAEVTVSNTGSPFPASLAMHFAVNPPAPDGTSISIFGSGGKDLVWDAGAGRIYVSLPGIQPASGNTVASIDPATGVATESGFLGSEPDRLSLTDNGQSLYVGLDGSNAIAQLTLPDLSINEKWNLGGDNEFLGPYYPIEIQAAPGAPDTTAVVLGFFDIGPPSAGIAIYDGAELRGISPRPLLYSFASVQWAGNASTLYSTDVDEDFLVLSVGPSGTTVDQHYASAFSRYPPAIHYDPGTGLVYTDGGEAIQPASGVIAGDYGSSGIAAPDSSMNRVFILGQTSAQSGTADFTIEAFDQSKFTPVGSLTISNVVGIPTGFIRWGSNGLAFTTETLAAPNDFGYSRPGLLYVIRGGFVNGAGGGGHVSASQLSPVQKTWGLKTEKTRKDKAGATAVLPLPPRR